jgi:hypothetical protein
LKSKMEESVIEARSRNIFGLIPITGVLPCKLQHAVSGWSLPRSDCSEKGKEAITGILERTIRRKICSSLWPFYALSIFGLL